MSIIIRTAEPDDLPAILDMGARFVAATNWASIIAPFDRESFQATTQRMMIPESGGVILLAQNGAGIAGMVGALIYPCFFNVEVLQAQEVFYWAEPEHRGHAGPILIEGIEVVCKGLGARVMIVGSVAGLRDKAVAELYARRGYRQGENSFVKAL